MRTRFAVLVFRGKIRGVDDEYPLHGNRRPEALIWLRSRYGQYLPTFIVSLMLRTARSIENISSSVTRRTRAERFLSPRGICLSSTWVRTFEDLASIFRSLDSVTSEPGPRPIEVCCSPTRLRGS